jgi:hypothetical protein
MMQGRGGGEVPLRMPRMREGWTLYDERVRAISWMMLLRPGQRPPHVITPNTARRWQGECRANHRQHEQRQHHHHMLACRRRIHVNLLPCTRTHKRLEGNTRTSRGRFAQSDGANDKAVIIHKPAGGEVGGGVAEGDGGYTRVRRGGGRAGGWSRGGRHGKMKYGVLVCS